jgi:acetyl esterase/lipase
MEAVPMTNGSSSHIETDVVFGRGGDVDLRLDIYHPTGPSKRTAVVQLHGGGFTRGAKENIAANCRAFAERGYTSLASQYRLAPDHRWPAQIHDVKAAVRWARVNAERLGVEPDRIVLAGYSAGAMAALVAAGSNGVSALEGDGGNEGVSSGVAACIAYYSSAQRRRPASGDDALMGPDATEADYEQASTITYASTAVPTIFFHSTGDTTIPFEASTKLFEAYRAGGAPVEMHIFDGLSHVFDRHSEFLSPTVEVCDLFLDRHVVEPRVYPPFAPGVARPG